MFARRDALMAGLLFLATACFTLWQNSQIAILWDLSYLLDISYRIALGQTPYRDFPLVHPPLTFLIQAATMRLAGRHYMFQIAYAALVGGLGSVFTWRIVLRILIDKVGSPWAISLLLAAPLTVLGIYSIYPHPIYDCDCAFAILVAILLLQRLSTAGEAREPSLGDWVRPSLTGAAVVLPVFFKQNMGLPFLLAVVAGILLLLVLHWIGKVRRLNRKPIPSPTVLGGFLTGIVVTSLAAVALIQITAGLDNYFHWTIYFAAQRRLSGVAEMLTVYRQPSFAWTLPVVGCGVLLLCLPLVERLWVRIFAFCLLSSSLAWSIVYLFLNDDLDERADNLLALWPLLLILSAIVALAALRKGITLSRLMPLFILAAIHGTFLSQQLWGSTYAIWPLLILLITQMLAVIPATARRLVPALACVISITFMACGGLYAASHERLDYIQVADEPDQPGEPIYRATLPALHGMSDRGQYLPNFEELVRFAATEIPPHDGILLLPGEEPFYFATGRTPQFPIQIFDRTTDPYSSQELLEAARSRNIRWVIVKTRLQSTEDPLPEQTLVYTLVAKEFSLYRKLGGYDIYRRP